MVAPPSKQVDKGRDRHPLLALNYDNGCSSLETGPEGLLMCAKMNVELGEWFPIVAVSGGSDSYLPVKRRFHTEIKSLRTRTGGCVAAA
jgi:hypothetical protein